MKRISVAEAFKAANITPAALYIKNNTKSANGVPCVRSIEGPAFTQLASHPLTWCTRDGTTVRCLNVSETAIIMGFGAEWILPNTSRASIRIGNGSATARGSDCESLDER